MMHSGRPLGTLCTLATEIERKSPAINRQATDADARVSLPMTLHMEWPQQFNHAFEQTSVKNNLYVVNYLNKVHVVHTVEVIARKNQHILYVFRFGILKSKKKKKHAVLQA